MANTVRLKRSAVQGKVPTTSDLDLGELALNTYDGKLYTKKDDGTASIVELSGSGSGGGASELDDLTDVTISSPSDDQFLRYDGSGWVNETYTPPVVSVNGSTGSVVLDADDIDDAFTTHKFVTAAQVSKIDNAASTQGSISQFVDVEISSTPSNGDALVYSGTAFAPTAITSSQWDNATGGINYAGGNVGIGTTNPTELLDVNGDALINGVNVGLGAGNVSTNTAIGGNALNVNTTGNINTAIGEDSLTANTTGSANTAIGQNSLGANTEGASNAAVGQGCLAANTTGSLNTAIGRNSLNKNTEGIENTAVGQGAATSNITGDYNTAIGRLALRNNATGNYNAVVGYNAGYYIEGSNNTILGAYQGTTADATLNDTVIISAGATERLRIDSTGNVGIGETSPAKLLDVNGDALINGITVGRGAGDFDTNTAFGFSALAANTTGDENTAVGRGALSSNTEGSDSTALGRSALGSNTTGLYNNGFGRLALFNNTEGDFNTAVGRNALFSNTTGDLNTGIGNNAGFYIEGNSNTVIGAYQGTTADATLNNTVIIAAGTVERLRINSSGNVGIGTTDPQRKLEIAGSGGAASVELRLNATDGGERQITFVGPGSNTHTIKSTGTSSNSLTFAQGSTERLRIDSSGNVGIGTTDPAKLLDVDGDVLLNGVTIGLGGGGQISNNAFGSNALIANTTGTFNTAVGSNSLLANTEGGSNIAAGQGALISNTTGSGNSAFGRQALGGNTEGSNNTGVGRQALNANTTGTFNTAVGRQAGFYIEGSSNTILGAYKGTTADATLNNTVIISAGITERLRIDSTGNVGIGTTDPQAKLDVNGDALINGMTVGLGAGNYSSNIAFGDNTFTSNTTGTFNVAIGQNSLQANTEGVSNTGVGQGTLVNNTTGSNNVAIGQVSLNANTEGDANTAVGRNALNSNITGSLNTAVGRNAGRYVGGSNNTILGAYQGTTADATLNDTVIISAGATERLRIDSSGNVGIGTTDPQQKLDVNGDALVNGLTVGRGAGNVLTNTVVGNLALNANTTGSNNTAVGRLCLLDNTTGSNNTAVGRSSLNANTEGNDNTASGQAALATNTTGNYNTAFGRTSLRENITGDYNTAIGYNAGYYIEGDNNTILGAYEGTTADATLNDTVIISAGQTERMRIKSDGTVNYSNVAVYANNTAALAGGLVAGDVYRKSDGTLMITF